jgi:hypothetical protein
MGLKQLFNCECIEYTIYDNDERNTDTTKSLAVCQWLYTNNFELIGHDYPWVVSLINDKQHFVTNVRI